MVSSETVADDSATEEEAPPERPAPPKPKRWLIGMSVLVVLLAASLIGGGLLLRSVVDYRDTADRREAITSAAKNMAQLSYSLDFETFPQQVQKIVAATTGKYRQGVIDSTQGLQYILTQGKVKSSSTITAAGIEKDDQNTATVLLSITTRITNTEVTTPQARNYRVAIGLVRQGSDWLVQSNDVIA